MLTKGPSKWKPVEKPEFDPEEIASYKEDPIYKVMALPVPKDFETRYSTNYKAAKQKWAEFHILNRFFSQDDPVILIRDQLPDHLFRLTLPSLQARLRKSAREFFPVEYKAEVFGIDAPSKSVVRLYKSRPSSNKSLGERELLAIERIVPSMSLETFKAYLHIFKDGDRGTVVVTRPSIELLEFCQKYLSGFTPLPQGVSLEHRNPPGHLILNGT